MLSIKPDHKLELTELGHQQAKEAGYQLKDLLNEGESLRFYVSPYTRTRQTLQGILTALDWKGNVETYEEPRLREQGWWYIFW